MNTVSTEALDPLEMKLQLVVSPPPAWVLGLNSGPLKQYALISPVLWLGFWSVYMLSKQEIGLGQVPSPYVTH